MQLRFTGAFARSVGGHWLPTRCAPTRPARRNNRSRASAAMPYGGREVRRASLVALAKPPFKRDARRQMVGDLVWSETCDMPDRDKTGSLLQLIVAAALGTPCSLSCSPVVMWHVRGVSNRCARDCRAK